MATPVPFRWISQLPDKAQKEIERNFEHLRQQISGSPTIFDAVIDPALAASNPGAHLYKNLTDLAASEPLTNATVTNVGVIARGANVKIVEPGNINLSTKGSICFIGQGVPQVDNSMPVWDWKGATLNTGGQTLTFRGIHLAPSSPISSLGSGSSATPQVFIDCVLDSNVGFASVGSLFAYNTTFSCNLVNTSGTTANCYDCRWVGGGSNNGQPIHWIGGEISVNMALSNSDFYIAAKITGSCTIVSPSTSGVGIYNMGGLGGNLSITSVAAIYVNIDGGDWNDVTMTTGDNSGTGFYAPHTFRGVVHGTLDVTGQALIYANMNPFTFSGGKFCKLRGGGINATIAVSAPMGNPMLQLIGCTDSIITIDFKSGSGTGGQAYSIDAASARCLILAGGVNGPYFTVASTNAGTNCTVITEGGAPPSGAAGGSLATTYPNPTFAGRDASVDAINKDMLPAMLIETAPATPQTYPPAASGGGAPSGPAGGSLGGTYPNPTFAGRDTSVDKINQDMLPAMLVEGAGVVTSGGPSPRDKTFFDTEKDLLPSLLVEQGSASPRVFGGQSIGMVTQVELDFGFTTPGRYESSFTISDAAATVGMQILASIANDNPTNTLADENEMEPWSVAAACLNNGFVTFSIAAEDTQRNGWLHGKRKVNYVIPLTNFPPSAIPSHASTHGRGASDPLDLVFKDMTQSFLVAGM